MKNILLSSVLSLSLLSGCASLGAVFSGKKEDPPIVVRIEKVYVGTPDDLMKECPDPVILTAAQILEISQATESEDLSSEDLYNRYFVLPTYEGHEACWKSIQSIKDWNETVEDQNKKEENAK